MNRPSTRLAAHGEHRQIEAVLKADHAAEAADLAVRHVWNQTRKLIHAGGSPFAVHSHAVALFQSLKPAVETAISDRLRGIADWGRRATRKNIGRTVPVRHLQAAVVFRRPLKEDFAHDWLRFHDLLKPFRDKDDAEPVVSDSVPNLLDILFPPPSQAIIHRVIYGDGWVDHFRASTSLGNPVALANIIAGGFAAGKMPREIEKDLLPHVEGVRVTARRIARTEGMRVAGEAQMNAYRQLGDLVVGYAVRATLDSHTRPWHAARNGTIYYLKPRAGQKGPYQMPHPPMEPDDPSERPAKAPKIAFNCRCFVTPVLSSPEGVSSDEPVFQNIRGSLIPDPISYSDWFSQADEKRRRLAVGTRRYNAVATSMHGDPDWAAFLDPVTGDLVPLARLESETWLERESRARKVREKLLALRSQLGELSTVGFLRQR